MSEELDGVSIEPTPSIFHSGLPLEAKLERARMELLDLSARNRLLNIPRSSRTARTIEIVDERSTEVFRVLVRENRTFTFLAGYSSKDDVAPDVESDEEEILALAQPEDQSVDERGVFNRHADTKLQTRLTSAGLQKRLLDLYTDARTLEEEQGVNVLYLALGTLKWIDPSNAKNIRYAPLILIPVVLERTSAADRFKLKARQEEFCSNLSLEAYLDRVHAMKLPAFEVGEDCDPAAYMTAVTAAVSSKEGWAVFTDQIVLGFFSFAKFLMYRDLDPQIWPKEGKLTDLPLIRSLLAEGFAFRENMIAEDEQIDRQIAPSDLCHIVDSDASQTLAIHDVRCGHNLVIQGPPGTGKSQTIANIVAAAIADGKTVLFVAEKMAALEVVKRRLDQAGVGDACLELHSNKANKRLLLEELRRTWDLGSPKGDFANNLNSRLQQTRDLLNSHAQKIHSIHHPSALTPYQVIGELVRLRAEGCSPTDIRLEGSEHWSPLDFRECRGIVTELVQRLRQIGRPVDHAWWCVGLVSILPTQVERIIHRVDALRSQLTELIAAQTNLAQALQLQPQRSFRNFDQARGLAERVATAPKRSGKEIGAQEWDVCLDRISQLLDAGSVHERLTAELTDLVRPGAWNTDVVETTRILATLPAGFDLEAFDRARRLYILLPQLIAASEQLRASLGIAGDSGTTTSIQCILDIGRYVASAPAASPDTLTAAVWDYGVEKVGDLVEAVAKSQEARSQIGSRLSEVAWSTDCTAIRQTLALHGSSSLRYFSSEWRSANRLVKSFLSAPDTPLELVLTLLDTLMKGQRALSDIKDSDTLGRSAFGPQWRGERSDVNELRTLLEWMRSLGPQAKEIRSIASRTQNQAEIGTCVACLQTVWDECLPLRVKVLHDLGEIDQAPIVLALQRLAEVVQSAAVCKDVFVKVPTLLTEQLVFLNKLLSCQSAANFIADNADFGKKCFGQAWDGTKSIWTDLGLTAAWIDANRDIRMLAAKTPARGEVAAQAQAASLLLETLISDTEVLFGKLDLDRFKLFGVDGVHDLSAERLGNCLNKWLANPEQLSKWVAYCERVSRGRALGLRQLIEPLEDGRLALDEATSVFDYAYYEALFERQILDSPALGRFDGQIHSRLHEFSELDRQRISAARLETVRAHHCRIPRGGGGIGPLGVLRAEIAKKKGHMSIRQLILNAAPAIQALKPVLMMSPLSVAQFLPPGKLSFDLLVMDEASQIQPVDALGAVARCRQVVVVGDERQLPPTKFFSKLTAEQAEDEEDGEVAQVADIESILGLFAARGLPQRMLRWHYRSRHQSLIAISNTQFYENKLFIVPSPYASDVGMGLRFHHVRDGRFDSGNTRINATEAKTVAEAVIRHALDHPDFSLGVATFSASQRRAIRDQIELLRRENPCAEAFFHSHPSEPFFIKNLENVQGDERDVIFISVGYGKNAEGRMTMAFGPLSAEGGERRLNVLISRAKRRCEVFSSITDEDIDLERGKGKGVVAFKLFLQFARTGRLITTQTPGRDSNGSFEVQVAKALQERGYQVHAQVGIAGFFIDLAIPDPGRAGRYLLGIECDGVSYHGARSARDRNRLRQSVLEDHGWILHRIWSIDWFQRPKDQLERTIAAIEAAKAELDLRGERRSGPKTDTAVPIEVMTIERGDSTEIALVEIGDVRSSTKYVEAAPMRPQGWPELHETPLNILSHMVEEIVTMEGPVHVDELTARIRDAWELQRAGGRIQAAVERAILHAKRSRRVEVKDDFLSIPGSVVRVRDRTEVNSANLRKPEMLPRAEVKAGVLQVVQRNLGGSQEQVISTVLRLLGFRVSSAQLRQTVQSAINGLIKERMLERQGEYFVVVDREPAMSSPSEVGLNAK